MTDKTKINAGSGVHTVDEPGWRNWDKFPEKENVERVDIEGPWPVEDSSVDTVLFNHSLEHVGQQPNTFLGIIKELYRVCCDGATIYINAPHHMSDEFWGDPTHCRPITADMWPLFSKKANQHFRDNGGANSCLAFQLDVDFELTNNQCVIDERFQYLKDDPSWQRLAATQRNVIREIRLEIKVIKPEKPNA